MNWQVYIGAGIAFSPTNYRTLTIGNTRATGCIISDPLLVDSTTVLSTPSNGNLSGYVIGNVPASKIPQPSYHLR